MKQEHSESYRSRLFILHVLGYFEALPLLSISTTRIRNKQFNKVNSTIDSFALLSNNSRDFNQLKKEHEYLLSNI